MLGKRSLFKLNLRDKFAPIKCEEIKFHREFSLRKTRIAKPTSWKTSPREISRSSSSFLKIVPNHSRIYFDIPSGIFTFLVFLLSSRGAPDRTWGYFLKKNFGIFSKDGKFHAIESTGGEIWIDIRSTSEMVEKSQIIGSKKRVIEFPTIARFEPLTFISRERVLDPGTDKSWESHWFPPDFTLDAYMHHAPETGRSRSDLTFDPLR